MAVEPVMIELDFGNVNPWDPTRSGISYPADGVYACEVAKLEKITNPKNGKERFEIDLVIEEPGDYSGTSMNAALFADFSKDANKAKLKAALAATGVPLEKLQGQKKFDLAGAMVGKKAVVLVRTPEGTDTQGRPKLPDILWVPVNQVEAIRAQYAGAPATTKPATTATAAAKPNVHALFD